MTWRRLDKTWHDTNVEYCDVCGNLLIQRAWVFQGVDGVAMRACREDDERLYTVLRTYAPRIDAARRDLEHEAAGEIAHE